jgi:hypothetical protein
MIRQTNMRDYVLRKFISALLALLGCGLVDAGADSVSGKEASSSVHVLTSGSTSVEIMDPFDPNRYNTGVRFTPLATVLGVRVDGHSYLYHPAQHDAKEDDGGLATEFDLCVPNGPVDDFPPGYNDAAVSEGFLKIGVGVLRKQKDPYSLFQQNEVIEPAKTTVTWTGNQAVFHQSCHDVRGYAYELGARVDVSAGRVIIQWDLANTGTKTLRTKQYTHDFMRIDDHDVADGYTLTFPYDFAAMGLESGQRQQGRSILFTADIPKWINAVVPFPPAYSGPNSFALKCSRTSASIRGEVSLPGLRTAIHARKAYIAPEQLVTVTVAPGEKATWVRTYNFLE